MIDMNKRRNENPRGIRSLVARWLGRSKKTTAGQSVQNTMTGGGITQVTGTQGNVRISRSNP